MKSIKLKTLILSLLVLVCFSCSTDNDPEPEIENPTADFNFNVTVAVSGQGVTFNDTSAMGSGAITSWSWTFTGATPNTSTEQNPTVIFNSKGEFSATLVVTANDGGTASASKNILAIEGCEVYDCEKFLVEVETNINYGVDAESHIMNIYKPKGDLRVNKPALLLSGGGQYEGSNLNNLEPLAQRLASYGFVVATAAYRDGIGDGTGNLMRGMVDSKAAVRFLRAKANDYNINPNEIFTGGWASGAYNALAHAYWQFEDINPPELYAFVTDVMGWIADWEGEQGNNGESSEVVGVVNLGGSIFGQYEAFQDDLWITSNDVPMFAVHGSADVETPCDALELETGNWEFGSCVIHQRLLDVGVSSTLYTIEGGAHESPRLPENIDNYIEDLVGFLSGE